MMKHGLLVVGMGVLILGLSTPAWPAKVAVLIPENRIPAGEDPINDPLSKQAVLDMLESMGDVGILWLIHHLENDLGHIVNIYGTDTDDPGFVENDNDLIFITEEIGSGTVAGDYRIATKPVIFTESYLLDDMGFTNGASAFTGGAMTNEIKIVNPNHPITQGMPETLAITQIDSFTGRPYMVTFGTLTDLSILADVGEILAVLPESVNESSNGDPLPENAPILIAVEAGTPLDRGDTNPARWVFLGYSDVDPNDLYDGDPTTRTLSVLNDLGIQLLDRSIAWALGTLTRIPDWPLR
ncbi:MAG TPA: hypothetical protein PK878_08595 [bacterium]|nr:hypothetical protein [Candidatus Omnitrophota bacterium]HOJ60333.1 hypothetical protein [bacterium]HOL96786.1 hypothetical protein [bacterium]HPO99269.1 hypothetical protein [bacterium]HXK92253.1 hypothetical protein [bacterium]